jgi:hypothetical protein
MIVYHTVFLTAVLIIFFNIRSCLKYLRAIDNTVGLAMLPPIATTLKDNQHHKKSLRTALNEHKRLMPLWFAGHITFFIMVWVWYSGSATGELSEFAAFLAAVAMTVNISRPLTDPIKWDWLIMWRSGVQAVMVVVQREMVVARIAEIKACDDAASDPVAYVELETLYDELERIDRIIGIALGSPQSENEVSP